MNCDAFNLFVIPAYLATVDCIVIAGRVVGEAAPGMRDDAPGWTFSEMSHMPVIKTLLFPQVTPHLFILLALYITL